MSIPPPPQQPEPAYGGQPAQAPPQAPYPAGPYAAPYTQQPGQPSYDAPYPQAPNAQPYPGPYAQQPGQGPYGAPYPQQPHPWGVPPMVPGLPQRRRRGLVLGVVGGVVGLVVVILVGLALIGFYAQSSLPEAKYQLHLPKTLIDGRYELAQDLSDSEGKKIVDESKGAWDAKVTAAVVGQYSLDGDDTKGALVVSGMYGRFTHVDQGRKAMLQGAAESDGVTVAVPPKDFPQADAPTVSCEVLNQKTAGTTITYPVCAWADDNTGAAVATITMETVAQQPSKVDLESAAKLTLQVRSETMEPIK